MKYFSEDEVTCQCGCGMSITQECKKMADDIRGEVGKPLIVNSGARCLDHNRSIGSSDTSSHVKGEAIDFKAKDSGLRFAIIKAAIKLGYTRIGVHESFVHVDCDKEKPQDVVWMY